ncbi:protein-methionine-sulfoxide reductase heme-binding subunit MsrQ [Lacimicrobium alkaliphilum]|uniref:Protein-methionine-sulfoxide reductase heme-binding subunit MsrQ n=1 Tax=Lacimicrobium alkaliphilum TaxID=1526571 RepID=A0ABQ1R0P0_9ALTE|nr:protein-methionine-sulfoxide reductase heme-binding subunit MsrQ [Lacimicrobium alkaliphilum]GGD51016.1 protein-methionine-sulfoxide reductase heme-binding subunit MsrQ [Lacimicrobium alkaliphilum]
MVSRIHFRPWQILGLKLLIHSLCIGWAGTTYYQAVTDQLGGDPVKAILHFTGISAFNLLLMSLCMSPLAKYFRQAQFIRFRRLLGLYAFLFAILHLLSYLLFELQLEWGMLISEIIKRPYITVGMIAWLLLMVLTLTSTQSIQRKLGRRWQKLHNWVYLAACLIALHYIWSVKSDIVQPALYIAMLAVLLGLRKDKLLKPLQAIRRKISTRA